MAGQVFYVGSTGDVNRRLAEHASGECHATSALFSGDFEVDRIEFPLSLADARRREDELTVELAALHGLARVFGGEYAAVPRPAFEAAFLLRRVDASLGRCYACHRAGHAKGQCPATRRPEAARQPPPPPRPPSATTHPLENDPLFAETRALVGTRAVNLGDFRSPVWCELEAVPQVHPARLLADLELRAGSTEDAPTLWYGHRCMAVNYWVCKDEDDPEVLRMPRELQEALARARDNPPLEDPFCKRKGEGPRVKRRRLEGHDEGGSSLERLAATWGDEAEALPEAEREEVVA